jgi:hypothetical protein
MTAFTNQTASYAMTALTASYVLGGAASIDTSSFVATASGALTNETASYAMNAATASYFVPTIIDGGHF